MYKKNIFSFVFFLTTLFSYVYIFAGNTHSAPEKLEISAPPARHTQAEPQNLGDVLFRQGATALQQAIRQNCALPAATGVDDLQNAAINHNHQPARYFLRILQNHNVIILPRDISSLPWMSERNLMASYPEVNLAWFTISTILQKRQKAQSNAGPPANE